MSLKIYVGKYLKVKVFKSLCINNINALDLCIKM